MGQDLHIAAIIFLKKPQSSHRTSYFWKDAFHHYGVAAGVKNCFSTSRLGMEHPDRVSIDGPPRSEACFCFELGLK